MLPFFVVGVGASAGGFEAFSELLNELPLTSGLAFVVIQHQDPRQKNSLTQMLTGKTIIPLVEAVDGQIIEPNCIYIVPPQTVMVLHNGQLIQHIRKDFPAPAMPINCLFQSLAREQGKQAIGIILSGMGIDGIQGLRAIREAGGATYAQNEDTAQFNGLPAAAREAGVVERVLSPAGIAQTLIQTARRQQCRTERNSPDEGLHNLDDENFRRLFHLLGKASSVDFTHYKRGTVKRRLSRRMKLSGINDMTEYLALLEHNPQEVQSLFDDLLIQVTDFFRDPEMFEGLSRIVFPRLMENRSEDAPLRFWIPGCASGEEVYSIAICLMEYLEDKPINGRIQLFGTDISDSAIDKARAGIFPAKIAQQVTASRLERYFTLIDGHYHINRKIRDLCVFARHDLVRHPPFSRIDLISCRNLLIYLDTTLQKRVIPRFHYALRTVGFLVLGESESISTYSELFSAVDGRLGIFCKTPLVERNRLTLMEEYPVQEERTPLKKNVVSDEPSEPERLQQEADRLALEHYVPPGVLCDNDMNILRFRGETSPYLTNPAGRPSLKLQKLARPGILVELGHAFEEARREKRMARREGLHLCETAGTRLVHLLVIPLILPPAQNPWFLVFFEDQGFISPENNLHRASRWLGEWRQKIVGRKNNEPDPWNEQIKRLNHEIEAAREYIQAMQIEHEQIQEDLKATEQELLSSNEEFQSANEELETAQEELQASNDELRARNRRLKELNQELQRACGFAEAIVETIHHPLLVLDGNLRVTRANQSYYDQFKTNVESTENRELYALGQNSWDLPPLRTMLNDIFMTSGVLQNVEICQTFPGIGQRTLSLNAQILRGSDHQSLILLAIQDITEHKSALEALQSINQRKDEFLAMLAHELRNPLAPIRNALEIWRRNTGDPGVIGEAQAMLDRQLRQETRLLDDLLDMSRVSRGVVTLKKQVFELNAWLATVVNDISSEFVAREQQFSLNLPQTPLTVEADPARLQQIILNLLNNAIKFTPAGGQISLTVSVEHQEVNLSVRDTGIGISPALLPTIFDLFVQADESLARPQGGLGLGLTLARRLVELHGGNITVRSGGPGQGSEFTVHLPCGVPLHQPVISDATPSVTGPHTVERVLIVDDNLDSAEGTAILLQLEGYTVKTAFDGYKALELVDEFNPDVIVLDIGLTGLDGYQVARRIRARACTPGPRLIAMTGYGQATDRARALQEGFDEHLVKPVDIDELIRIIEMKYDRSG